MGRARPVRAQKATTQETRADGVHPAHRHLVSKAAKSATSSPDCIVPSSSRCHPGWGSVRTQGPPGRAGKVLGDVQPPTLKQACRALEPAPAPAGAPLLPRAGFGCGEWQGIYPVSSHGLTGACTAVRWGCTGSSRPVSLRLVPPLLPGELLRPAKAGFGPQHRFSPAMQINLLVTKKRALTGALHHLHMSEALAFPPSFSSCSKPRAASST